MKLIPAQKPQLTKLEAEKIVRHFLGGNLPPMVLIGVRGYYSKTLGPTEGNDINLYDDAMIIWGMDLFKTFNSNTDPSFANKGLAMLVPGVYRFYRGKHKNKYNALRSYPEGVKLDCTRDGVASKCSAINIHYGSDATGGKDVVWSAGCQTLPKSQWPEFIQTVYAAMLKNKMLTVTYILIDAETMSKILSTK